MTSNAYQIVPGHITTPWADDINPHQPWHEYPRPQMVRDGWQNLNGLWEFTTTPEDALQPENFPEQILVPFPLESALSGVKRPLQPDQVLWYHHTFRLESGWETGRTLIHFGAVDWSCRLWINGQPIGEHTGGYDPFTFEITHAVSHKKNDLVLAVLDPSDTMPIQRGKQVLKPQFIWYTAVSGIWQTVWLEHVPDVYISSIKVTPNIDRDRITIECQVDPEPAFDMTILAKVLNKGDVIASSEGSANTPIQVKLPDPQLWSPETPHLYDLEITLKQDERKLDTVRSYFGMRKFSVERTEDGILRFHLNHKPYFLYGPLDQGYWPDGLYTPPTDEAVRWEIDFLKDAGFNMLRKHVKVEPARYYYHCDRAGLIVWQDMVSGGISPKPIWFFFAGLFKHLKDTRWYQHLGRRTKENRNQFKLEYRRMLEALYNAVSIAIWCPFNEGWGQFNAKELAGWTREFDPTRLVDHASGWFDQGGGNFKSEHIYFKPLPKPDPDASRAWVLSEFGGYSLNLPKHAWNPEKDFGYKKFTNRASLTRGYLELLQSQLSSWIDAGLSAAVYTQTTDVESEVNGFLTYDRKLSKMDLDAIRKAHQALLVINP